MRRSLPTFAIIATVTAASVAFAAGHAEIPREVKARQGMMNVISINLGVIGDMAKGETPYDADVASAAADSLLGVALVDQSNLWPAATLGVEGNRGLAKIDEDRVAFDAIWEEFDTAAANLKSVAADGQEGLGAALGTLGQTCKACHDDYRQTR